MSQTLTLVVHTGGIGDFLLACPALERLAKEGPVELLGKPERLALAVAGGIAVAAHDIESSGFESVFTEPAPRLRAFLARYDRCIVWMRDGGSIAEAIHRCGVAVVRAFAGLPPEGYDRHASRYYAECLGYTEIDAPFGLAVEASGTHDVIIHPGSGSRGKNWPLEHFIAVADGLAAENRRVTWCLGPAEGHLRLPASFETVPSPALVDVAHVLAGTRLFLGNDSGIAHLAASVGCPTVAVFGPSNAAVWAPRGPYVEVVQGRPWPAIADVLNAACRLWDTRPRSAT
ncbi:MAG TPA: glycosyltransferase family 9 protein [Candidatus Hydrogenedentes bacterium]|nr:glycosyltransferase family 9 protein [Candidatus Hydrogenedentota bacterium]HPG65749.1 glycosyltransferase family 9 protein [Candidatus Hydrogenedentota bacterium]